LGVLQNPKMKQNKLFFIHMRDTKNGRWALTDFLKLIIVFNHRSL
jgi:heme/copper-type cytochrome/quinol oxidase subunit 4